MLRSIYKGTFSFHEINSSGIIPCSLKIERIAKGLQASHFLLKDSCDNGCCIEFNPKGMLMLKDDDNRVRMSQSDGTPLNIVPISRSNIEAY